LHAVYSVHAVHYGQAGHAVYYVQALLFVQTVHAAYCGHPVQTLSLT